MDGSRDAGSGSAPRASYFAAHSSNGKGWSVFPSSGSPFGSPLMPRLWDLASDSVASSVERRTVASTEEPRLLACSMAASQRKLQAQLRSTFPAVDGSVVYRRRGFFEHFRPRPLATSTMRVFTQQSAQLMSSYMSDQMEADKKRKEKVDNGEISQLEADELEEEWEQEEWKKRWETFPARFITAFAKYQTITFMMRIYEYTAEFIFKCGDEKMVMLTKDIFADAKAVAADNKGKSGTIVRETFRANVWANFIAYLADLSVHQILLCVGYYMYIRKKQKQVNSSTTVTLESQRTVVDGPLFYSFVNKSSRLATVRVIGCAFYSMGAALGTLVSPGWGTLFFANMGEGLSTVILDESGGAPKA